MTAISSVSPQDILSFWFKETDPENWFWKNSAFDAEIRSRSGAVFEAASDGTLKAWEETPEGCAALVIVLDQFSRNLFRDDARAFATDAPALVLTKMAIEQGWLDRIPADRANFLLTPLMHSEDLADQEIGIPLFAKCGGTQKEDYAIRHRDIIARFGRFPHRNEVLGRMSTPEEEPSLTEPGSSF